MNKDGGCISGNLPTTENKAFAVNYPGYPSSLDRAIQTLGGTHTILKARSSHSNKLDLHFRPEDPYSHPVSGKLHPSNNFLLRLSKPNPHATTSPDKVGTQDSEPQDQVFADIVAHVSEAYHFNGMADYQHVLAVHADVARKRKRNWADVEQQFEKHDLIDVDQEDLMMLLPPLFSLKNRPENLVLKPSMDVSLKKKQEAIVKQRWEMDIEPSLAIDFNIKEIPKQISWEKYIPEGSDQWKWQTAVCELFDERPIWIKNSLAERMRKKGIEFGDNSLRRILFRVGYYFSNGPFLKFWIKKGYDPRKDPESRIYQRIDFRVPPPLRSYCDTEVSSRSRHKWEDICAFRVFPCKCQTSLQLFELADDYIQVEIRKPSTQATCSFATGWFTPGVLDSMRLCIAVRFLTVYPSGAEYLLKSASARFEKSKKTRFLVKDKRPTEEKLQSNKEPLVDGKKVMNDDDDDDDDENDEDEVEDDIAEDEMDEDEAPDLADEDTDFSLQNTYQENISKNYLQELFGSFPYSDPTGKEFLDTENNDGEYQIYEQYSDGDFSDRD